MASFSGGKDSTAMTLELIERNEPLDEVLFCDTYKEFPAMYSHIKKVRQIIEDAGMKFTIIKSEKSFDYYMFDHEPKRHNERLIGLKGYSWMDARSRWCTTMLKLNILDNYVREISKKYHVYQYVGLAADEEYRLKRKHNQRIDFIHPLVDWGWSEKDCLNYCYVKGFDWGGLYEIFERVSCWCCPLQSLEDLRKLRKHFPALWEELHDMDVRTWRKFKPKFSVEQLELRFQLEDERAAQGLTTNGKTKEFREALRERLNSIKAKLK